MESLISNLCFIYEDKFPWIHVNSRETSVLSLTFHIFCVVMPPISCKPIGAFFLLLGGGGGAQIVSWLMAVPTFCLFEYWFELWLYVITKPMLFDDTLPVLLELNFHLDKLWHWTFYPAYRVFDCYCHWVNLIFSHLNISSFSFLSN